MIKIEVLTENLFEDYKNFLLNNTGALFYYSLNFKNFLVNLLNCKNDYIISIENGEIKGVLPLMFIDGEYGRVYNSLPFFGSNGGIISSSRESYDLLIKEYNSIITDTQVGASTIISNPLIECNYEDIKYDLTDIRIGMLTNLKFKQNHEEMILTEIDSTARRNINKAINSNIIVEIDNSQIEFLKNLHQENMRAIGGREKDDRFFSLIHRHFEEEKDYNIYVAKKEGKMIAGLLLFYFNKTVEYFTPGIMKEFGSLQPLSLIIYKAMVDASKQGYYFWNWGGTWLTQEGVYRFKKKWATISREYLYYIKINNPKIYNASKEELLNEYKFFYVIPFTKLKEG
ncbi:MAG: peptidoglycan bridge formation glycyltransferase FemA/FemB family protein [bacterium]